MPLAQTSYEAESAVLTKRAKKSRRANCLRGKAGQRHGGGERRTSQLSATCERRATVVSLEIHLTTDDERRLP